VQQADIDTFRAFDDAESDWRRLNGLTRGGEAWSDEDDALLRSLVQNGVGLPMMARRLERTQSAIQKRASRLRLALRSR
jgi:hypothetical protein